MKDRIKLIRKNAGVTQEEFAVSLGLSRIMIAHVETEKASLSDRSIRDICRLYNVNEEWLRTGEGDMYPPRSRNQQIADFVNNAMEGSDEDFKKKLIYGLTTLGAEDWDDLARIIKKMAAANKKEDV